MNIEVAKQFIFECAAELLHGSENLSNVEIASKLLYVIKELDTDTEDFIEDEPAFWCTDCSDKGYLESGQFCECDVGYAERLMGVSKEVDDMLEDE